MSPLKNTLLNNWHFVRVIRLIFGLIMAYQAIRFLDAFAGVLASFFLFQAATNTGCCGSEVCAAPTSRKNDENTIEVAYEEIRTNKP